MTKAVCKAMMRRSALENKFYKNKLPETGIVYKKQKNYTKELIKKKKFWHFWWCVFVFVVAFRIPESLL